MIWIGFVASLLLQDDETAKQLVDAGKRAAEWTSYRYESESDIDSGYFGGNVRPKGSFLKGVGFSMKMEDTEVLRANGKTAVKNPGEEWKKPPEDRGGEFSLKALTTKYFPPPHEIVGRMEAKFFKTVKVEGATEFISAVECVIFEAELTEEGARKMSGLGSLADRAKNFTGTVKLWIDDTYTIRRYKLDAKAGLAGPLGEIAVSLKGKVDFDQIGAAKVEIPEAAKKVLE